MKIEHESSPRSNGPGLITPLYKTVQKLDDGGPISRREFTEQYGLFLEKICLKRIRIPRNVTMEEIQKYFGPIQNQNGYNYVFKEILRLLQKLRVCG
jgi:hypothetical protein